MTIHDQIRKLALQYDLHWSDQKLLEFALDYIEDVEQTEGFIRHLRTNTQAAGGTLVVHEDIERKKDFTVASVDIPIITTRNIMRRKKALDKVEPLPFAEGLARAKQVPPLELTPEQKKIAHDPEMPENFGKPVMVAGSSQHNPAYHPFSNNSTADSVVLLRHEPEPATVETPMTELPRGLVQSFLDRLNKKK